MLSSYLLPLGCFQRQRNPRGPHECPRPQDPRLPPLHRCMAHRPRPLHHTLLLPNLLHPLLAIHEHGLVKDGIDHVFWYVGQGIVMVDDINEEGGRSASSSRRNLGYYWRTVRALRSTHHRAPRAPLRWPSAFARTQYSCTNVSAAPSSSSRPHPSPP